ncbi:hypothetical protein EIG75_16735 [Pseudomonas syringae]|uniref:Uncharacterized protein n=3 Tax=Pseudomonas syringae group TaxID=136849 RepID=A0A6B2AQ43_PSESX|nr:hypothetical protein [Pseudomonas syringae]NAO41542.1 hypothetical protein [Pseudomonas syringae]NAO47016.1 hypothetical protein [Pseudomonas syringae]NAO60576.1 hypothetical protein [Pseudomonas syringae]NAO65852.1 hypothetical protein [Pseudomonas syringae]
MPRTRLSVIKTATKSRNVEALMSLELTIVMLIASWLAVASAMLWGVMRVSRRRHQPRSVEPRAVQPAVLAKHIKAPVVAAN